MAWKNPLDMFWTCSVEPRLFLLYFLIQLGMGLPWTALSLMFYTEIVPPVGMINNLAFNDGAGECLLCHCVHSLEF